MTALAVVVAALVGVGCGVVSARLLGRRGQAGVSDGEHAADASHPADEREDIELARGLRSAVDRLEMGVVLCDAALQVTYRNRAAMSLHGTHGGVIIDHHLRQIFDATQAGRSTSRIVELHGPPKVTFAIEALAVPDGGAVATVEDISERVRIDSMRTDFVANISHELKTPVGAIAVLAEMLVDEPDREVVSNLSERVVEESHRAVRTIDDLLELSSIESTHAVDDVVAVADLIAEAVGRGRSAAAGRHVTVTAIDRPDPIHIRANRPQLASAIGNLVENAVKYSNDGGAVQIRTRLGERWVEVMVADQGVGIPARDLDRVFERFYRVDKARARETGGTGLGLAIVRHVMNNHGGDVSVSSQEGEGSTFVLRLPVRLITATPAISVMSASNQGDEADD